MGYLSKKLDWENLEEEFSAKISSCAPAIIILLLIGAIGGTWMVSGIVPTMIYYGMQIIQPEWFLVSSSLLCALVSLMIGSSWTTVATIGVALMGIGKAHGFADGWIAGSIITGAYFGDKLSPLSDTTVLASSVSGTPLFTHIRYMLYTTVPTFCVSILVFFVAGLTIFSLVTAGTCSHRRDDCPSMALHGGLVCGYPTGCRGGRTVPARLGTSGEHRCQRRVHLCL